MSSASPSWQDHTAHVERTVLAWRRTGLAVFALAAAAAKVAAVSSVPVVAALGLAVGLFTLGVIYVAERRVTKQDRDVQWTLLATMGALVVAVALLGALLAIAS